MHNLIQLFWSGHRGQKNKSIHSDNPIDEFLKTRGFSSKRIEAYDAEPWNRYDLTTRMTSAFEAKELTKKLAILVYERDCGDIGTFRYFGYNVTQRLKDSKTWHAAFIYLDELDEATDLVQRADVIILVRCRIRPELISLATVAKNKKIPMGYLIDDNALGSDSAQKIISLMANDPNSQFERDFWTGTVNRFRLAAKLCDCVITTNGFFSNVIETQGFVSGGVIHSSLNDEQVAVAQSILDNAAPEATDKSFIIGYFSGTKSHQADFDIAKPSVIDFLTAKENAKLLIVGELDLDQELQRLLSVGKVIVLPKVDYVVLQYLQAAVDVVLAPLVIDDFTNCKSALKIFEAGVVKTPALASPSESYLEAVDQSISGYICHSPEDWLAALEEIYTSKDKASELSENARRFALSHYYGEKSRAEMEATLENVASITLTQIPEAMITAVESKEIKNWDDPFEASPAFANEIVS